jgi:hypothetical protein
MRSPSTGREMNGSAPIIQSTTTFTIITAVQPDRTRAPLRTLRFSRSWRKIAPLHSLTGVLSVNAC